MPKPSPLDSWSTGIAAWQMMVEAHTVMTLRMAGMAGMWTMAPGETTRMVTEKHTAFAESALLLAAAVAAGERPERIAAEALRPIGRATRANARRLGRAWDRR